MAVVSQLLLAGADAGAAGSDGRTPAHALAEAAHGTQGAAVAGLIANMLLRHGAQVSRGACTSCRAEGLLVSCHQRV